MNVTVLTATEAASEAADFLGVGQAGFALDSPEGVAASLRRAASFLCPTTHRQGSVVVLMPGAQIADPFNSLRQPAHTRQHASIAADRETCDSNVETPYLPG